MPVQVEYFYRLRDDHIVSEFCVAGSGQDPGQYVETMGPDGRSHRWVKRIEGGLTVFHPPDAYHGGQPLGWAYDRTVQIGRAMDRAELERRAMRGRVSRIVPAFNLA